MKKKFQREIRFLLAALVVATVMGSPAKPDDARRMVTQPVNDDVSVALPGNVRPEAIAANDRGAVDGSMPLEHMQLLLKRPPEKEAALVRLIDQLHDPASPRFHHWLTPKRLADEFGPAVEDVGEVTDWLVRRGFAVNVVQTSRMMVDFSGTAAQVRTAFKTEIHHLVVRGVAHTANMSDPHVPAALAGVVHGVVSLNDFRPHTNIKAKRDYTIGSGTYAVVPADLAKIYRLTALFSAGISGQGQTIVLIEDSNVYKPTDWNMFRKTFGLSQYTSGNLFQVHPAPASGTNNCRNPGIISGNEAEAEVDMEWATAAAPSATIMLASCADTQTSFGGLIALQNLVNGDSPPAIVSISYGECEVENGATANAAYSSTYQQAVAEGTSIYVSAGDEGAASCDADENMATHGIGVNGFASTSYNVAVGGTDFGDSYAGTNSTYWNSTNGTGDGSALSYIPEIPWNDSCASVLLATYAGFSTTYGSAGFCNSSTGKSDYLTTGAGSGGPSHCASGAATGSGVVGGTCQGNPKPSWQSLLGNPSDGVRDLPDVSLFAADGVWGHYYIYCDSDDPDGGSCSGMPSNWSGGGGTSFGAPIWAGIQALINQKTGSAQGNPNPRLYALAAAEYGSTGTTSCLSSRGKTVGGSCVFYDVTLGDIDVNCTGGHNCYLPSGTNGVLSTSLANYAIAYKSTKGWDFATGIGTVNVTNLVNSW